jgi:hypothetical protein
MFTPFHKLPYTYPYGKSVDETLTPGPLFIIRNNFPFTVLLFSFSVIINFENTKTFPLLHFTNQNTTSISFTVYIIALHILAARIFAGAVAFSYLYCIFISSFVNLHIPCAWQPLDEVEGTKQIYSTLQVVRRGT